MRPTLVLRHGSRSLSLTERAVSIGRLEECEVLLDGAQISRRHARIVPTPEGPLLVDRSRFGTWLNGAQVVAPSLLRTGDVILIGSHEFVVEMGTAEPLGRPERGLRPALTTWRRRYGIAEALGTLALVLAALAVRDLAGSLVLAAVAGSLAEAGWFYGVLLLRDWRRERAHARQGGCAPRPLRELAHDLLLEFGAAERVDGFLLRPCCLWLGLRLAGGWPGLLAGKLAADLLFYGPLLSFLHWRSANAPAAALPPSDPHRRETTATEVPLTPR